jgi:hydrogenase small subunit
VYRLHRIAAARHPPTIENLILNTISLEYHEVLSAAFGHQAEENKHNAIERYKGKYVLVVDGSIPLKDGGIYCMVAGEPIVDHIRRAAADAAAVISSCAAWGGARQRRQPDRCRQPGGGPRQPRHADYQYPGLPAQPHNFLTTVAYYITYGKLPALDAKKRPLFAYERLIHENCERRPHFDAGRCQGVGDEGHRQGWCLYHLGCKGPETYGTARPGVLRRGRWHLAGGHRPSLLRLQRAGVGFSKGSSSSPRWRITPRVNKPDVKPSRRAHVAHRHRPYRWGARGAGRGESDDGARARSPAEAP